MVAAKMWKRSSCPAIPGCKRRASSIGGVVGLGEEKRVNVLNVVISVLFESRLNAAFRLRRRTATGVTARVLTFTATRLDVASSKTSRSSRASQVESNIVHRNSQVSKSSKKASEDQASVREHVASVACEKLWRLEPSSATPAQYSQ